MNRDYGSYPMPAPDGPAYYKVWFIDQWGVVFHRRVYAASVIQAIGDAWRNELTTALPGEPMTHFCGVEKEEHEVNIVQ